MEKPRTEDVILIPVGDSLHDVPEDIVLRPGEREITDLLAPLRQLEIGLWKVVTNAEQRHPRSLRHRVGDAVPEVELRRMPPLSEAKPGGKGGSRVMLVERYDPDVELLEQIVDQRGRIPLQA